MQTVDTQAAVTVDGASVAAPTSRIIRFDLSEDEAVAAAALFDVAVKAAGLKVAEAALHLTRKLQVATSAAQT